MTVSDKVPRMENMEELFETFEHGADMGIRGRGRTLEEAFANGAKAVFSLMVDLSTVALRNEIQVACTAPDQETLFMVWLNRLIAMADIEKMGLAEFTVAIDGLNLSASAWGERIDPRRHDLGVEVKGATYTMLRIYAEGDYIVAQCVVDV